MKKYINIDCIIDDISAEKDYLYWLKEDIAKSERRIDILNKLCDVLSSHGVVSLDREIYYNDFKLENLLRPFILEDRLNNLEQKVSRKKK